MIKNPISLFALYYCTVKYYVFSPCFTNIGIHLYLSGQIVLVFTGNQTATYIFYIFYKNIEYFGLWYPFLNSTLFSNFNFQARYQ